MDRTPDLAQPWRMQFSLRLALIALTAFAIGFPIWYRWPYEEVHLEKSPAGTVVAKRVSTWQRQWGGGRLQHGYEKSFLGDTVMSAMYTHGMEHGPYEQTYKGKTKLKGQYLHGMKDGPWVYYERPKVTSHWKRGKLDGPYEIEYAKGRTAQMQFSAGRLKQVNGKPAANRLFDLLESGSIEPAIANELRKETVMEFVEVPLREVINYIQDLHKIPIVLDHSLPEKSKLQPITATHHGLDLISALTLLTASHDLGVDYRYGFIWVTTIEDAEDWRDPTGVSEVHPPKGSDLARAWNEPVAVEVVRTPLSSVLSALAQRLAIEIDTTQIAPTADNPDAFSLMANLKSPRFHNALGFVLYQTNCRCQLDGDKLIILPPDSQNSDAKPPAKP
jgi:hypothetical protein